MKADKERDIDLELFTRPVDLELLRLSIDLLEVAKGTPAERAACRFIEYVTSPPRLLIGNEGQQRVGNMRRIVCFFRGHLWDYTLDDRRVCAYCEKAEDFLGSEELHGNPVARFQAWLNRR